MLTFVLTWFDSANGLIFFLCLFFFFSSFLSFRFFFSFVVIAAV